MFDASAQGGPREANSPGAWWLGTLARVGDAGGTPAIRIGRYALPPSTGWPSARQRSMPPVKLATSLKPFCCRMMVACAHRPTARDTRDQRQVRADRDLIVSEAEVISLPTTDRAGTD